MEGSSALKLYGQFTGGENATPVYQELSTSEGETYTFSVSAFSHAEDPLAGANQLTVDLVFFDASYNFYVLTSSPVFDASMADSTWHNLAVTATAPAGATIVQAVIASPSVLEMRQALAMIPVRFIWMMRSFFSKSIAALLSKLLLIHIEIEPFRKSVVPMCRLMTTGFPVAATLRASSSAA